MGRMSTVEEIKAAIEKLSIDDRARLERLLHGWADDEWDRQIAADASAGRLDGVLERVDRAIDAGHLRDLP
jgi:hypothetical protein